MPTNGISLPTHSTGTEPVPVRAVELYRFYHNGDEETFALRGISLELHLGEFIALTGPSGSGKSTLLACLAGLDEPDGGHVDILGSRMSRRPEAVRASLRARHIGMLMQVGNLFSHLSVEENMVLQMALARQTSAPQIDHLLAVMGLGERRAARLSQLSGGEAARAGLLVALSANPQVLLADEPTAEVDAGTEAAILDYLAQRCRAGAAALVATHSNAVAARADRILVVRDGRLSDE